MARPRCSVSWCSNEGKFYYRGDRVTKQGQDRHKRGLPVFAQQFYKSYYWVCNMHHHDGRYDKAWDKWQKENSIASEIYRANWGDY